LNVDRPALVQALISVARSNGSTHDLEPRLRLSQYVLSLQRAIESESRWRSQPPSTLNLLLPLLDGVKDVAQVFATHGVDAARVRAEARRMSG
jgi:hypothetical protein